MKKVIYFLLHQRKRKNGKHWIIYNALSTALELFVNESDDDCHDHNENDNN